MKKYFVISFGLVLGFVFLIGCSRGLDSVKGKYKPSEQLGDMEIKSDGKVVFKKLGIEGQAVVDGDQVAVKTAHATFFFTKKADGTLVEGVMSPSEKLVSPPKRSDLEPGKPCPLCGHIYESPENESNFTGDGSLPSAGTPTFPLSPPKGAPMPESSLQHNSAKKK